MTSVWTKVYDDEVSLPLMDAAQRIYPDLRIQLVVYIDRGWRFCEGFTKAVASTTGSTCTSARLWNESSDARPESTPRVPCRRRNGLGSGLRRSVLGRGNRLRRQDGMGGWKGCRGLTDAIRSLWAIWSRIFTKLILDWRGTFRA